jgi:hypothetical protein
MSINVYELQHYTRPLKHVHTPPPPSYKLRNRSEMTLYQYSSLFVSIAHSYVLIHKGYVHAIILNVAVSYKELYIYRKVYISYYVCI